MGWDRPEASCFFHFWGEYSSFSLTTHLQRQVCFLATLLPTSCGTNKNPMMRLARYGSLGDILVVKH